MRPLLQHRYSHLDLNAVSTSTQATALHEGIKQLSVDVCAHRRYIGNGEEKKKKGDGHDAQ